MFSLMLSSCAVEKQKKTTFEEKNAEKIENNEKKEKETSVIPKDEQDKNAPVDVYENENLDGEAVSTFANDPETEQYIKARLDELLKKWDPKNVDGEIAKLNNTRSNSHLSDETVQLLLNCITLSEKTGGLLDITMYPLTRMWGFESEEPKKPEDMLVTLVISKCGMDTITVSNNMFTLGTYTMLDASAVTSGYAADLISAELSEMGCKQALISVEDHIRCFGVNSDSAKWSVLLSDPFEGNTPYATLMLEADHSVSTKGSYQHYYEEAGKRYCNIFNPETGMPVDNDLVAASVVCSNGMTADAYATACFILGGEGAKKFYRDHTDFELILVYKNGDIHISEGLANSFKSADKNKNVTVFNK